MTKGKDFLIYFIFLLIIFAGVGGFLFWRIFFFQDKMVPPGFLLARQQASLIARDIVGAAEESGIQLGKINELEQDRDFNTALNLITQELARNKEMRSQAINLSRELEKMTEGVSEIRPFKAKQLALEAINYEVTLINRLILYNDLLVNLLEALRGRFLGGNSGYDRKVEEIIGQINEEVKAINDLNRNFNEAMAEFEELT